MNLYRFSLGITLFVIALLLAFVTQGLSEEIKFLGATLCVCFSALIMALAFPNERGKDESKQ